MTDQHDTLTIDVDELRAMLEDTPPVTVLDMRKAEDRAEWAIPGSLPRRRLRGAQGRRPRCACRRRPFPRMRRW